MITEFYGYVFGYTYALQEALNTATLSITELHGNVYATPTRARRR